MGVHDSVPIIDLRHGDAAASIDRACRAHGFFVAVGHGVDPALFDVLAAGAADFFDQDASRKETVAMSRFGRSWRGWFPPGGELTSGVPDGKEGLYLGADLPSDDERVAARTPLHGPNPRFPDIPGFDAAVTGTLDALTALGHRVLELVAAGLGLESGWFRRNLTADPTILFRIFHYPPAGAVPDAAWGVQEHTDYGLVTLLRTDDVGGLEIRTSGGWREVPVVEDGIVCNIGDMLERVTGGVYRSTPHRVRVPPRARFSFPFFFDPSWDAEIVPVPGLGDVGDPPPRWDGRSVFSFTGTYGEYLTAKVARVFPELWATGSGTT